MARDADQRTRLGARIREARLALDLSQAELARAVGTTVESISRAERGTITPTIWTLLEIGRALDVGIAYLVGEPTSAEPALEPKVARALRLISRLSDDELDALVGFLAALDRRAPRKVRSGSR